MELTLRPSSIGSYISCQWQWYNVHILNRNTIPSARAALGTSIHKVAEVILNEAIETRHKDLNISKANDIAIQEYNELLKKDEPVFEDGDTKESIEKEILNGTKSWLDDIAPIIDIPIAVEKFYEVKTPNNPIFARVAGSIDYVGENTLHDIKSTRRKPTLQNYDLQQGCYALLREKNGENVDSVKIQAVILGKKETKGQILDLIKDSTDPFRELNDIKNQSRYIINNILEKAKVLNTDTINPEILFTGNPKSMLCSPKYCSLYNECKFVKGVL